MKIRPDVYKLPWYSFSTNLTNNEQLKEKCFVESPYKKTSILVLISRVWTLPYWMGGPLLGFCSCLSTGFFLLSIGFIMAFHKWRNNNLFGNVIVNVYSLQLEDLSCCKIAIMPNISESFRTIHSQTSKEVISLALYALSKRK